MSTRANKNNSGSTYSLKLIAWFDSHSEFTIHHSTRTLQDPELGWWFQGSPNLAREIPLSECTGSSLYPRSGEQDIHGNTAATSNATKQVMKSTSTGYGTGRGWGGTGKTSGSNSAIVKGIAGSVGTTVHPTPTFPLWPQLLPIFLYPNHLYPAPVMFLFYFYHSDPIMLTISTPHPHPSLTLSFTSSVPHTRIIDLELFTDDWTGETKYRLQPHESGWC